MSNKIMRKIVTATALVAIMATSAYARDVSPEIAGLLQQYAVDNDHCRGGSGDNPETSKWCDARDRDDQQLTKLGWCYGPENVPGSKQQWQPCSDHMRATPDAQAKAPDAKPFTPMAEQGG